MVQVTLAPWLMLYFAKLIEILAATHGGRFFIPLTQDNGVAPRGYVNSTQVHVLLRETHLRNILLINRSLFTGFLFLPFGISVHIWSGRYQKNCEKPKISEFHLLYVLKDLSDGLTPAV